MEHLHQVTSLKRKQYATTLNKQQRAKAMTDASQEETHPDVVSFGDSCVKATAIGPRKGHIKVEEQRRRSRMNRRAEALREWEACGHQSQAQKEPWMELDIALDASDDEDGAVAL